MSISERFTFFTQARSNFEQTGAIQSSSRYLAEAMAAPLRRFRITDAITPVRILEIGPGTGAITRAICTCMGPQDKLDCYEINAEFVQYLGGAIHRDKVLAPVADQIRIHHAPAQELTKGDRFDFAICSAPLNNFDAATINAILEPMLVAVTAQGTATLFEYIFFPALRRAFAQGDLRTRLREAQSEKSQWLTTCGRNSMLVLRNIPPARVHEFGPFIS
ncbi:MAG TPA: methyltransferase domain-containing protein [Acidobacteriota bacterium]|jgi:phospholipid N-methyltransferase|nr:methyltransferase domain-containing protein [Acidobacteriota bacterium]MEE2648752.1 methyltransferase domain-containing protein [Acidobacteriota bacterium]HJN47731.1 methyltransferase domain-containing protein [Acidobacteriota bacterium]|tara:strand:+ start:388 stop:1044 length:657 start_codon:yes stop_codon:yes gene_type:complete